MKNSYIILYVISIVAILGCFIYTTKKWIEKQLQNISNNIIIKIQKEQHRQNKKIREELDLCCLSNKLEKLCIIGVGGGGCNILEDITTIDPRHIFICINSDIQALQKKSIKNKILLQYDKKQGIGCGGDAICGAMLIDDTIKKQLFKLVRDFKKVCIISTLGGGVGSGAITQVVKYLKSIKKDITVAITLPFTFEGKIRAKTANQTLKELQNLTKNIIVVKNDTYLENEKIKNNGTSDTFRYISKDIWIKIIRSKRQ